MINSYINSSLDKKADSNSTNAISVTKDVVPDAAGYINANFLAASSASGRCGYGFHIKNVAGGFLTMATNGELHWITTDGKAFRINMTEL